MHRLKGLFGNVAHPRYLWSVSHWLKSDQIWYVFSIFVRDANARTIASSLTDECVAKQFVLHVQNSDRRKRITLFVNGLVFLSVSVVKLMEPLDLDLYENACKIYVSRLLKAHDAKRLLFFFVCSSLSVLHFPKSSLIVDTELDPTRFPFRTTGKNRGRLGFDQRRHADCRKGSQRNGTLLWHFPQVLEKVSYYWRRFLHKLARP